MAQKFLPESRYSRKTCLLNWKENPKSFVNEIVHVKPTAYNSEIGLYVDGEDFKGIIPLTELTIYPQNAFNLSKILINRGHLITAKITDFFDNQFILSRKESMEEALVEVLDELQAETKIYAKITGFYNEITFLDIGGGINAILPLYEVTLTTENPFTFFEGMDSIKVKLLNESYSNKNKFVASFIKAFDPLPISVGDVVKGRIVRKISDNSGYIVEISPVQSGIVDVSQPWITLHTGQTYLFRISRIRLSENGFIHYSLHLICE